MNDTAAPVSDQRIVFITQIPNRRDKATGAWAPSFSVGPAAEWGTIKTIMPSNASFFDASNLLRQLKSALKEYDFHRGDSIVCSGDPVIIAVAGSVLADLGRKYRLLKWERSVSRYVAVEVHL